MTRDELLALIDEAERDGRKKLDLMDQEIGELPPEIGCLKKLEHLDLEGNDLTGLPDELFELESLQHLDLQKNSLPTLSPSIAQLKNLSALYLSNNQLSSLPPEVAQLQNLSILFLNNNQLSSLPPPNSPNSKISRNCPSTETRYRRSTTAPGPNCAPTSRAWPRASPSTKRNYS